MTPPDWSSLSLNGPVELPLLPGVVSSGTLCCAAAAGGSGSVCATENTTIAQEIAAMRPRKTATRLRPRTASISLAIRRCKNGANGRAVPGRLGEIEADRHGGGGDDRDIAVRIVRH